MDAAPDSHPFAVHSVNFFAHHLLMLVSKTRHKGIVDHVTGQ